MIGHRVFLAFQASAVETGINSHSTFFQHSSLKQMVVVFAFRYRDKSTGDHMRNLTEGCGYFLGNSATMHVCGRNRVITESDFKRTSKLLRLTKRDLSIQPP